jgi:carbonic anhydrase
MSDQINISRKEVEGKCDLKCAYNFKYTSNTGTAMNDETSISVRIEKTTILPVFYNKQKYTPVQMSIYYPSTLLYNDKLFDAEIRIAHIPETGGKNFIVSIPIIMSSNSTSATTAITNIIKSVSVSAPSKGESVTISGLNLENIVPKKPFYNFDYSGLYDCIAFGGLDAIPISSSTLDTLKQIIEPQQESIIKSETNGLYYNSSGPNSSSGSIGEGIYISCNPTGNSEETTEVTYDKNETEYDSGNIFEDPTFILIMQTIIACVVFILICYAWNFIYSFIDDEFASNINNVKR